jgi:hypothetical protein
MGAGLVYCSACRSVFSAADPACYACGADVASAVPLDAGSPVGPIVRAPLADTPPSIEEPPPVPGRLERAILEVQPRTVALLVAGVVAVVIALGLAAAALGLDATTWLFALAVVLVAIAIPVVAPKIAGADFVGLILRYELLLAVVVVMLIPGQLLPPEIRWPLLVVSVVVAFAMGRARVR